MLKNLFSFFGNRNHGGVDATRVKGVRGRGSFNSGQGE